MTKFLGCMVRDRVTGLVGIADQYRELYTGSRQYSVQPRGDGKDLPQAYCIDVEQLEIAPGPSASPIVTVTAAPPTSIVLGDEVEDVVTGLIGYAVTKTIFLNGCIYFNVRENKKYAMKSGDPADSFVSHNQLVVRAHRKLQAEIEKLNPSSATPQSGIGGPTMPSMRMR